MTPDQDDRLRPLFDKLFEVVALECNPDNWSGAGRAPKDLTPQERGDATWCRKQALASLTLLTKLQWLIHNPTGEEVPDEETLIANAEAEAKKMLDKLAANGAAGAIGRKGG